MRVRRVELTPRLEAALSMLSGSRTVADIGSDHGRLCAALLQRGVCERVIATDISEPSLLKAEQLIRYIGMSDRVTFRVGDGLRVLNPNECDAIALLGIGGTLMCEILDASETPLCGAASAVLQPMRAQCDIREYLYRHGYHITDDRVVAERDRLYQIFRAVPIGTEQPWPDGFPKDFFDVGFVAFVNRDENLPALCSGQLFQHEKRLISAKGTEGEGKLSEKIAALRQILQAF